MPDFVQYSITIKIIHEPEATDAPYVAYIPEFDVSSCGKTEMEAARNVKEVLKITIEEVKKAKKMRAFLGELGILKEKRMLEFPKIIIESYSFSTV